MSSKSLMNPASMFDPEALMRRFFRRADNVVWDMTTGKPGVATVDGIASCVGTGEDAQITINPIAAMGMAIPAFAQNTAIEKVELGDMIIYGARDSTGWVTSKTDKSLHLIKPDGTHTQISPPKTQMLDVGGGVMVVRSLLNMLGAGSAGAGGGIGGLMGTMMMMKSLGGGDGDLEDMLPMILMSQGAAATSGDPTAAAMAGPMAGLQQMLPMMMMAKLMGRKGGGDSPTFGFGSDRKGPQFRG